MDLQLNFDKKEISSNVTKFLAANLPNVEDRNSIRRIEKLYKLNYMEANSLIQAILKALIIEDGEEENPIGKKSDPLEDMSFEESNSQEIESSGSQKNVTQSVDENSEKKTKLLVTKIDPKDICRFYKNGKCKFNKDCRYAHPPICKNFRKFGLRRNNDKGCDTKCESFHPNACRDSLKTRTCERSDCRFFHLKGTKTVNEVNIEQKNKSHSNSMVNGYQKEESEASQFIVFQKWQNSQNLQAPSQQKVPEVKSQVFQKDQSSIEATLAEIMRQMAEMRAQIQQQHPKPGSSSQADWRN